ncbi:hypothetical protein ABE437_14515 [Isoptericola cucumis]|uniref:hypothetical protein n=1 Tax=Isoptericola cucumis TaxID=1776856 RepID=UPI0032083014
MTDDTRSFVPDLARLTDAADDSFSVRRAYGEPYEHQGQLVIPVAKVWGGIGTGAGGGAGTGMGRGSGSGASSGSGRGTGKSSGEGVVPGWRRSFSVGGTPAADQADDAEAAEGTATSGQASGPSHGSAHGDASGEAQGDAKGEAQGELGGEGSGEGAGGGGGFGLRVKPVGVYVVSAEGTRYQPVLDLNKVILGGQAVGIAIALAAGWAIGRRRR